MVPQHRTLRSGEAAVDLRLAAVHQGGTLVALARAPTVGVAPQRDGRARGAHCRSCALAVAHDHLGPEVEVRLRDLDRVEATLPREVAIKLVSGRSRAIGVLALLARDAELPVNVTAPVVENRACASGHRRRRNGRGGPTRVGRPWTRSGAEPAFGQPADRNLSPPLSF